MPLPRLTGRIVAFSTYWLGLDTKLLITAGAVVPIGPLALEILVLLVEAEGRVVSAQTLMNSVWPASAATLNTVQAQISALRRALGEDRNLVTTVLKRGYRFAGQIRSLAEADTLAGSALTQLHEGTKTDSGFLGMERSRVPRLTEQWGGTTMHSVSEASDALYAFNSIESTSGYAIVDSPVLAVHYRNSAAVENRDRTGSFAATQYSDGDSLTPRWKPRHQTRFIGRHAELSELMALVPEQRLVTLTGPPGIGKTRLASELSTRLAASFPQGVVFIGLSSLAQPDRVADTLAAALMTVSNVASDALDRLIARLNGHRILLVVDHCDHLVEATKKVVESLLASTRGPHIIVTSETPLLVQEEYSVAVAPLRVGVEDGDALGRESLDLFYASLGALLRSDMRKHSSGGDPSIDTAARNICRRVNGVPYAVELAAAMVAARVRASMPLATALQAFLNSLEAAIARQAGGRRLDLSRGALVRAVLQHSYDQLDDHARAALRRLCVFSGAFRHESAVSLLSVLSDIRPRPAFKNPGMLVDARLIEYVDCDGATRLRFHESARSFILGRLHAAADVAVTLGATAPDEHAQAVEAHARYMAADMAARVYPGMRNAAHAGRDEIDDVRSALEWSVYHGKAMRAADLLEDSAPLWIALSLGQEYVGWVRTALHSVNEASEPRIQDEMRLQVILARALILTRQESVEIVASWERAHALATISANTPYRVRTLLGLLLCAIDTADVQRGRDLLDTYRGLAQSAPDLLNGDRIEGILHAYAGRYGEAIPLLIRTTSLGATAREREVGRAAEVEAIRQGLSLDQLARAMLAAVSWYGGRTPVPIEESSTNSDHVSTAEPNGRCISLGFACALAMYRNDSVQAELHAARLAQVAHAAGIGRWLHAALRFELWLKAHRGDMAAARDVVDDIVHRFEYKSVRLFDIALLATTLPRLIALEDPQWNAALSARLGTEIERGASYGLDAERWHLPDLMWLKAMALHSAGAPSNETADVLQAAIQVARAQDARRRVWQFSVDLTLLETGRDSPERMRAMLSKLGDEWPGGASDGFVEEAGVWLERVMGEGSIWW